MKTTFLRISLIFVLLHLSGCAASPRQDWYAFQKAVRPAFSEHVAAVAAMEPIEANQKSDAQAVRILRDDIVPHYDRIIANLETIHPATPEVQEVHKFYLAAMQKHRKATVLMTDALERHDTSKMQEGSAVLNDAQKDLQTVAAKQTELNAKYGRAP